MAKLIAFSGPSLSGKTTTINYLKSEYDVRVLPENIREYVVTTIDDLRKDPNVYLNLQIYVILAKIIKEFLYVVFTKKPILADRSLMDSYYYLITYVSTDQLSTWGMLKFRIFKAFLGFYIRHIYKFLVYRILFFSPLVKAESDRFRPKLLDAKIEHRSMTQIYLDFCACNYDLKQIILINLNDSETALNEVYDILDKIADTKEIH